MSRQAFLVVLACWASACVPSKPRADETLDASLVRPASPVAYGEIDASTDAASSRGDDVPSASRGRTAASCEGVQFRRAWRFRGESTITPSPGAELAAFHVTTSVSEGIRFLLDVDGHSLDTPLQFARADAKGLPVDRFHESTEAPHGPIDLVAVGAVPKGTTKLTVTLRARVPGSTLHCVREMDLVEGPVWPPMPRYAVSRYAVTKARTLLVLYRADNVLLEETGAPTLYWKPDGGAVTRDGMRVEEGRSGLPRAMVTTNDKGEPITPSLEAKSRFAVAEYEWRDTKTRETANLPNEYTAGDGMRPLPSITPWTVSDRLNDALNAAEKVDLEYGTVGAAVFLHGGKAQLERMIDAGSISRL